MSKKPPAAQTNDATATTATDKKRTRQKSEYVIERKITRADQHGQDINGWETDKSGPFSDTAAALKYMQYPISQLAPGDYRIVVVKWQRTVKKVQQTITQFE